MPTTTPSSRGLTAGSMEGHENAKGFTQKYKVHDLVYYEKHFSAESAIRREKRLKEWKRQWKVELVEKDNPKWRDFYAEITGSRGQAAG